MSLSEQIQRVDGGQNAALKAFIEKFGGTVSGTTKIDGYAALIQALTIYSATQQISATTKRQLGLGSTATPDNALQTLRSLVNTAQTTANSKANQSSLNSLAQTVNNKADAATVTALSQEVSSKAYIATGSYVGTGAKGESNPTILTLSFKPKTVFISRGDLARNGFMDTTLLQYGCVGAIIISTYDGANDANYYVATTSWGENSVSLYNDAAAGQMNDSGTTYFYTAVG